MKKLRIAGLVAVVLVPLAFVGLYVASIGDAKHGLDRIPAAIVNQDTAITTTNADGTTNYVLAGRQLVTQLTGILGQLRVLVPALESGKARWTTKEISLTIQP